MPEAVGASPKHTQTTHFIFEGGHLAIRTDGHGDANGSGYFQFEEADMQWRQHEESSDMYLSIDVAKSELLELRDQLNKHFPSAD